MSVITKPDNNSEVQHGNENADAYTMLHGDTKIAVLRKADLAAEERFVLVDLSDSAQFPHTETGKIHLYAITLEAEKKADGRFIIYFGVVIEVDTTDGSTKWFAIVDLEHDQNPTDATDRLLYKFAWDGGIDLEVDTGALVNVVSNTGDVDETGWDTDVALDSPIGDTSNAPGVGDLVMLLEEPSGTGTVSVTVTVEYITEEA